MKDPYDLDSDLKLKFRKVWRTLWFVRVFNALSREFKGNGIISPPNPESENTQNKNNNTSGGKK